ncbi:hypothetical protein [Melittangium boletus]|uniref:Uncharacterized protein n=1 Tax=Melittangium boletus DSM 14713 TaxID=1294270 RepID=A0A250ILN3_9BACT|nr:hypothetical protein [Melittangium boletus]ATB32649.1 hypothetical protein MEBOL_006137 [Melittangium boletus DSM 14713]
MKRLLTVALLCGAATAFAADKPAPKTAPKAEPKAETKTMPAEAKDLKVEEPDQKDPKNKEVDTKAQGEVKKDSF